MTQINELDNLDEIIANLTEEEIAELEKELPPEENWSEKVEDPRELEWKYCFTPEERIIISKEILDSKK